MEIHKHSLYTANNKVYSKVLFPANYRIYEFSGDVLTTEQLKTRHPSDVADFLQIGIDLWKSKSGSFDDDVAHSCNPNCYVKIVGHRAILTSAFVIQPNMELTYDYSCTSTETKEQWAMDCKCGFIRCRKIISGYQYLPPNILQEYEKAGYLPQYILKNVAG
jgi:SET domain-containing protein